MRIDNVDSSLDVSNLVQYFVPNLPYSVCVECCGSRSLFFSVRVYTLSHFKTCDTAFFHLYGKPLIIRPLTLLETRIKVLFRFWFDLVVWNEDHQQGPSFVTGFHCSNCKYF